MGEFVEVLEGAVDVPKDVEETAGDGKNWDYFQESATRFSEVLADFEKWKESNLE